MTYTHATNTLSYFLANTGAAKPGSPSVTVTKDIWAVLGANGKA